MLKIWLAPKSIMSPACWFCFAGRFQACKVCLLKRSSSKNCSSRIDWSPKNQSASPLLPLWLYIGDCRPPSSFGTIAESGADPTTATPVSLVLCQQPWKSVDFASIVPIRPHLRTKTCKTCIFCWNVLVTNIAEIQTSITHTKESGIFSMSLINGELASNETINFKE